MESRHDIVSRMTPVEQLVVLGSAPVWQEENRPQLRELATACIDWKGAFALARRHLIEPLFLHNLQIAGVCSIIPSQVLLKARERAIRNTAKNLQKSRALDDIISRLKSCGIQAVVLKGSALSMTVYKDEYLRTFSDIDLLVPGGDLAQAESLLKQSGFNLCRGIYPVDHRLNRQLGCEWTYVSNCGIAVELHWNLTDRTSPFLFDADRLLARAIPVNLGGDMPFTAHALCHEDQLIHLCVHQFKHHWRYLRDLCDISGLIRNTDLDWNAVISKSRRSEADRCLYYTLLLANRLLEAPVPNEVIDELNILINPGTLSTSIFAVIESNVMAFDSPHGFWPLILVNSRRNKVHILRKNVTRHLAVPDPEAPGIAGATAQWRRLVIFGARNALASIRYLKLLNRLSTALMKNAFAGLIKNA